MLREGYLEAILGLPELLYDEATISPGAGMAASFSWKFVIRLDRRLSNLGDGCAEERCMPALSAAAACNDDNAGERGDGGVFVNGLSVATPIVARVWEGEADVDMVGGGDLDAGRELRSGGIMRCSRVPMNECYLCMLRAASCGTVLCYCTAIN